ncbi:hypothetical protein [Streptosporangium sp. KLBMP 9127]|nr:hypothetical protein [Streptosporangium sp. KLBMP 9127]
MFTDTIPTMDAPPLGAVPSRVRTVIGDSPVARRTLLKGLVVSAVAATLVPFDWVFSRRAARADGPTSEWTAPNCRDAYSEGYTEMRANWGPGPAVCYGGWRVGDYPCNEDQRHFEGSRSSSDGEEMFSAYRIDSACGETSTRNAWRWSNAGNTYRCSDAVTTVTWTDGSEYTDITIAMCRLGTSRRTP